MTISVPSWYVIRSKPRQERVACDHLCRQGYETWLPEAPFQRKRRGKWEEALEPLFPGYLFVRLQPGVQSWSPIRSTRGVSCLVSFGNQPQEMPDGAVEALRQLNNAMLSRGGVVPFRAGDVLQVSSGPFAGWEGVYHSTDAEDRVVILLNILGAEQRLSVRKDDVSSP